MEWIAHRRPGLLEAEIDGGLVGLHLDRGICFGFNVTATRVWALIAEPRRLSDLCDLLSNEFEITPEQARADVAVLLEDLRSDGLVDLTPA